MIKRIKEELENRVSKVMQEFDNLGTTEEDLAKRKRLVDEVKILTELLQKEDTNDDIRVFNSEKIEVDKIKNNNSNVIETEKLNVEKIKLDNDLFINKEKIKCEVNKLENEVNKNKQDYEINISKNKIDKNKNIDNYELELKKLEHTISKDKQDNLLKKMELKIGVIHEMGLNSDRAMKILIDGASIVIPAIFYNVWVNRGYKFEETGTVTSSTFKNLLSKIKPTK